MQSAQCRLLVDTVLRRAVCRSASCLLVDTVLHNFLIECLAFTTWKPRSNNSVND